MDYKVRLDDGRVVGGTSSTVVVLWYPHAQNVVGQAIDKARDSKGASRSWSKAERRGSTGAFLFVVGDRTATAQLAVGTLSQTTLRVRVLIDAGSNKWQLGTVVKAGARSIAGDNDVDADARATTLADQQQGLLVVGADYQLVGEVVNHDAGTPSDRSDDYQTYDPITAEDGSTWFFRSSSTPLVRCNALSTVGLLGSGKMLVETSPHTGSFVVIEI